MNVTEGGEVQDLRDDKYCKEIIVACIIYEIVLKQKKN